jgi:hypothetical protein
MTCRIDRNAAAPPEARSASICHGPSLCHDLANACIATSRVTAGSLGTRRPGPFPCGEPNSASDADLMAFWHLLGAMCGVIVQIIRLIPPERHDDRLSACAHILNEISDAVEHTTLNGANTTKH